MKWAFPAGLLLFLTSSVALGQSFLDFSASDNTIDTGTYVKLENNGIFDKDDNDAQSGSASISITKTCLANVVNGNNVSNSDFLANGTVNTTGLTAAARVAFDNRMKSDANWEAFIINDGYVESDIEVTVNHPSSGNQFIVQADVTLTADAPPEDNNGDHNTDYIVKVTFAGYYATATWDDANNRWNISYFYRTLLNDLEFGSTTDDGDLNWSESFHLFNVPDDTDVSAQAYINQSLSDFVNDYSHTGAQWTGAWDAKAKVDFVKAHLQ